jgi:hypothetical protein
MAPRPIELRRTSLSTPPRANRRIPHVCPAASATSIIAGKGGAAKTYELSENSMADDIVNAEVIGDERRRPTKRRRARQLAALGLVAPGILFFGWCGIGLLGFRMSSNPQKVYDALAEIEPIEIPSGLEPDYASWNLVTGYKSVEFKHATTRSYLEVSMGPGYELEHGSTRQDSYDRGVTAAGGTPRAPTTTKKFRFVVRDHPAEFIHKNYANFETLSGFFQGRQRPVFLDARFDHTSYAPGTARDLLEHFGH